MPAPKDYVKIQYPRKCNQCEYISNNPQMWHYHNKTHDPIPIGQLCDHGCGKSAMYKNTGGIYSCTKVSHQCTEYLRKHSIRIKEHWQRPEAEERKIQTAKTLLKSACNSVAVEKMKRTKREKFGTLDPKRAKDFRHYARYVRERAQKWAKENGYVLGKQTFHVDHMFSIIDAFNNNLPENIVNHPANLQILEAKKNLSKGSKSILTVDELYDVIKKYENGN